jgi:hypothetical protein
MTMKINARPWPDIVEHYRNLVEDHGWPLEPMLDLVRCIEASPYASGLVAYTSVADLIVAQSEANFWRGPELKIEFDHLESKQFTFTYRQRLDDADPWSRTAQADEAFDVLERFLMKRARWFRMLSDAEQSSPSPSSG